MRNLKRKGLILLAFIFMVPIGTLHHEYGHYLAAIAFDYKAKIHHGSTSWHNEKTDSQKSSAEIRCQSMLIGTAGPSWTILFGLMGFGILYRRSRRQKTFDHYSFLSLFLTFFLSRQVFNFFMLLFLVFFYGRIGRGDETTLSQALEWPYWSIPFLLFVPAVILLSYAVFILLPRHYRLDWIMCGILGSGIGYWCWFEWLGPVILP